MIPEKVKQLLKKQHYEIVGKHSAVQICRWTKKSIRNQGVCYKEKFYGINCHQCCQMTPAVMWCPNKCVHCWRAIEHTLGEKLEGKTDSASEIVDGCIKAQRKLLQGFKKLPLTEKTSMSKANMKKWREAQEPTQFAISLSGEPTVYEKIGELIEELRQRGKTSFLVTNGIYPEKIKELAEKNQLPTQLYVSVNSPNKKMYQEFHRSCRKDAWERLNQTLGLLPTLTPLAYPEKSSLKIFTKGKCRTVFRINLVKGINMEEAHAEEFAELIKKSKPMFIEIKGFMSVGFARARLGYDRMPTHKEIMDFARRIEKSTDYKILDEQEFSRVCVLGKNKNDLKIKKL